MPDIGWMELLVIGVVALIVVGPKDLPMMFRRLGQFTGRIRAMARDFQRAMDEAADETGMTELNRDLKSAAKFSTNPRRAGMDALKKTVGDIGIDPEDYDEGSETRKIVEAKLARQKDLKAQAAERREAKKSAVAPEAAPETAIPEAPAETAETAEAPAARTGTDTK